MKHIYQARAPGSNPPIWQESPPPGKGIGMALFRRTVETAEEAAVRRMNWLEKKRESTIPRDGMYSMTIRESDSIAASIDRHCPPPPPNEVEVDWDTLDPIVEPPVFQMQNGLWVAGCRDCDFDCDNNEIKYLKLVSGILTIGATREDALRNIKEMKELRK